ncbi:MAG TPA: DUF4232 domain-containing protein [Actinospica sp.]|nr:DUF4232 domain-containing protein [Actinospica sp.]
MYRVPLGGPRRMAVGAGLFTLTLAACTACVGSSTPSSGATTSPATGTTASAGTASTTGAGTSTTATGATGGGSGSGSGAGTSLSTCQAAQLSGSIGSSQGTAGSVYVDVVFKNTGSRPCTLAGYPGVSFGAGSPVHQVGQPADRNTQVSPATVTLLPNGHAYAVLQVGDAGNYPASTCDPTPTTSLQVYPPNNTGRISVAYSSTGCRGDVVTLHVEAVQPGTGPAQ